MASIEGIKDSQVVIRVYRALRDVAGPGDEWDIEMALLEQWIGDFEIGIDYAENHEQEERAREAIEAAQALRRAIMAHVAAPGAEDDESEG